jgi:pectin lyase
MNQWLIWGGDAITVVDAGQVWIDHNNFARIGRQFIATGLAEVGNLTISNNLFDGANEYAMSCDGKHYWTLLLAGKDENVTLIANRFSSTAGRAPEYGNGGILHIVNNLWDDDDGVIMVNPQRATSAVLEGNYFSPTSERMMPVAIPFADPRNPEKDLSPFPVYAPLDQTIDMANPTCLAVLGRNCASNYATLTTFGVDTLKGFLLHPEPIRMMKASPTLARGVGTVRPMPYAKVAGHVKAKAGPQADPDQ